MKLRQYWCRITFSVTNIIAWRNVSREYINQVFVGSLYIVTASYCRRQLETALNQTAYVSMHCISVSCLSEINVVVQTACFFFQGESISRHELKVTNHLGNQSFPYSKSGLDFLKKDFFLTKPLCTMERYGALILLGYLLATHWDGCFSLLSC